RRCGAMLWLAAAREGLDDDHAAAAARAWLRQHAQLLRFGGAVGLVRRHAGRPGEQFAGARDVGCAMAIGEQSIVTDAMHALGQHMHEEAADERVGWQRHGLVDTAAGRYAGGWSFLLFPGFWRGCDSRSSGLSMAAIMPVATR